MIAPYTHEEYAEMHGNSIAHDMLNEMIACDNQSETVTVLSTGLNDAFNPDGDLIIDAAAKGFAVALVNVLQRGIDALRTDGTNPGTYSADSRNSVRRTGIRKR